MRGLFLTAALGLAPLYFHGADGAGVDAVSGRLRELQQAHRIPAVAVAALENGEVVYSAGLSLEDNGRGAVSEDTRFRIASLTKLFTAQSVMQLAQAGRLSLDDDVGGHVPQLAGSGITVRHLLTHSAGLRDGVRPAPFDRQRSFESYLSAVLETRGTAAPGERFRYSDTGYNLLGRIVSEVSGQTYAEYVGQHILSPAGMSQTGFCSGGEGIRADVEPCHNGRVLPEGRRRPCDASFFPSEGLISSVGDLARWVNLVLSGDDAILSRAAHEAMWTPQLETPWGDAWIGLGWFVGGKEDDRTLFHQGGVRGYESIVVVFPESMQAIIVLTNSSDVPRWEIVELVRSGLGWR